MESAATGTTNFLNVTSLPVDECIEDILGDTGFLSFQIAMVVVMAVICFAGNSLVIVLMKKDNKLDTPMASFMISLAASDILHGLCYTLYNLSHIDSELFRRTFGLWSVCGSLLVVLLSAYKASSFSLVGITVLRFMSIQWPLQHKHMLSKPRVTTAIAVTWSLAFMFGAAFYARPQPDDYCGVCLFLVTMAPYQKAGHIIVSNTIPAVIMLCLYWRMTRLYNKHMTAMCKALRGSRVSAKMRTASKSLSRVSTFLVAYFVFSFLPITINTIVHAIWKPFYNGYLRSIVQILYFSNTCVNFFAYMAVHHDFRRAFIKTFCYSMHLEKSQNLTLQATRQSSTGACGLEDGSITPNMTQRMPLKRGSVATVLEDVSLTPNLTLKVPVKHSSSATVLHDGSLTPNMTLKVPIKHSSSATRLEDGSLTPNMTLNVPGKHGSSSSISEGSLTPDVAIKAENKNSNCEVKDGLAGTIRAIGTVSLDVTTATAAKESCELGFELVLLEPTVKATN